MSIPSVPNRRSRLSAVSPGRRAQADRASPKRLRRRPSSSGPTTQPLRLPGHLCPPTRRASLQRHRAPLLRASSNRPSCPNSPSSAPVSSLLSGDPGHQYNSAGRPPFAPQRPRPPANSGQHFDSTTQIAAWPQLDQPTQPPTRPPTSSASCRRCLDRLGGSAAGTVRCSWVSPSSFPRWRRPNRLYGDSARPRA